MTLYSKWVRTQPGVVDYLPIFRQKEVAK